MTIRLTNSQLTAAKRIMTINRVDPTLGGVVGPVGRNSTFKHDLEFDFGYPRTSELNFNLFYEMYRRNGIGRALVDKTSLKTWQNHPELLEDDERSALETKLEKDIRQHFADIRFWQNLQSVDARGMVGKYSGLIFQLGDGKPYDQPVETVPGAIYGLISVIPCWETQLEPSSWDTDPRSPTYGQPKMFRFNESQVDSSSGKIRSFSVHPDRCIIWSRDGTVFGESKIEPCYNALMDLEKIRGAGGEGFWKNSKSQPVLEASPEVDFAQLANMLGTDLGGLPAALDEVIAKWSKGFDDSLILQGMQVKSLPVTLPSNPEQFFNIAIQEVSAAWPMPQKILVGMQTGERASTEDAREWAQTCMSRRQNTVIPNIMAIVNRMERWGMIPERDWNLSWDDLTAPTLGEKVDIADKMASVNQRMFAMGELVFTEDEIRGVSGYDSREVSDMSEFTIEEQEEVTEEEAIEEEV